MRSIEPNRQINEIVSWSIGFLFVIALPALGTAQPTIKDIPVAGPSANFEMSSRLMTSGKRMKVAVGVPGAGKAAMAKFNGTFFYRHDQPEATSATLLLRTDGLEDLEGSVAKKLSDAFDFEHHPFIAFQSESASKSPGGVALKGTLIVKSRSTSATLHLVAPGKVEVNGKNESYLQAKGKMKVDTSELGLDSLGTTLEFDLDLFLFNYTTASAVATGISTSSLDRSPPALPKKADELSNAGWYLMLTHRYPEAIAAFDRSIEANPGGISAYFRRGDAYLFNGDYGKAMGTYQALSVMMPLQPHILELSKVLDNRRLTPASLQQLSKQWQARQR